mmetsp:Transcript_41998/g.105355  ORF Transcript_41998/g.105355 Transcript_41998/m.105355 type:complete len:206 (-) Transcript_41998:842-1459(-)
MTSAFRAGEASPPVAGAESSPGELAAARSPPSPARTSSSRKLRRRPTTGDESPLPGASPPGAAPLSAASRRSCSSVRLSLQEPAFSAAPPIPSPSASPSSRAGAASSSSPSSFPSVSRSSSTSMLICSWPSGRVAPLTEKCSCPGLSSRCTGSSCRKRSDELAQPTSMSPHTLAYTVRVAKLRSADMKGATPGTSCVSCSTIGGA